MSRCSANSIRKRGGRPCRNLGVHTDRNLSQWQKSLRTGRECTSPEATTVMMQRRAPCAQPQPLPVFDQLSRENGWRQLTHLSGHGVSTAGTPCHATQLLRTQETETCPSSARDWSWSRHNLYIVFNHIALNQIIFYFILHCIQYILHCIQYILHCKQCVYIYTLYHIILNHIVLHHIILYHIVLYYTILYYIAHKVNSK